MIPCSCCPTGQYREVDTGVEDLTQPVFAAATVVASAPGVAVVDLFRTFDGVTATNIISGLNSPIGSEADREEIIDYTLPSDRQNVVGIRLWNNAGNVLNDSDGMGPSTIVELRSATDGVLWSSLLNAGNGGAPFTTAVPRLSGVRKLRLRNIGRINGAVNIGPLWREINLQSTTIRRDVAMLCNGIPKWYDMATSNEVPV